ncbi:MAG: valine--tRNA ligase, partial [Actinomycetota bacterium]|nr:valine--tRNA ligase [Actinomycetota bacterium]
QQDTIARFRRMSGAAVFYPMGWDDNGLPTERRVENYFGVRCDPSLPYDPSFQPPAEPDTKNKVSISRPNFVELCHRLTAEDEKAFEAVWRRLGLSVDWSFTYATIDDRSQRTSQRAFLSNLARGEAYQAEAPTLWDVVFQTAVAQAELEDRDTAGAYHRLRFHGRDNEAVEIETTRPELVAACVALVAHPDDARYRDRVGTTARTPLFGVEVPIMAHELADPEKGSGIAMICTFGDVTDVLWWRELGLPVRSIVRRDGRIQGEPPPGVPDSAAWRAIAGKTVKQAQEAMVSMLRESGDLVGEPRPITHPVKFFEKGDRPLEIVTSRQWFIKVLEHRDELLRLGKQLVWHPAFMQARYDSWVEGLNTDWLISRQRFFGVPIPLWYRVDGDGEPVYAEPLVPAEDRLPIDPSTDVPDGYTEDQRGVPGGFIGDPDVMDTWATSSLTPQIATGWIGDPDLLGRTFPMDLRPQGPEIIRTWLFVSVVRSWFEHGQLPWTDAMINGWVLDPDRKKMSKSKGNVVTPMALLEEYGSDAVRYWSASARPGTDTAFDEGQMRIGRRLAIKILNASRFVLSRLDEVPGEGVPTAPLDQAFLARLAGLVDEATTSFFEYDYARSLERTEALFWAFCDDYLELVKSRAYGSQGPEAAASANRALTLALSTFLRLFAPILPFVTEEVWSWWREGSVHRAPWPTSDELWPAARDADPLVLDVAAAVLAEIRKAKTAAHASMRAEVARVVVRDTPERLAALAQAHLDVCEAGRAAELVRQESDEFGVEVELARQNGSEAS